MTKYLILIIGAVLVAASGSNAQMGSPLNNPDMACTIEGRCVNATSKCAINGVNRTGRDCLRCLSGDGVLARLPAVVRRNAPLDERVQAHCRPRGRTTHS